MPLFRLLADRPDPCSPRFEVLATPAERLAEQLAKLPDNTAHAAALVAHQQSVPVSEVLSAWLGGGPPLRRESANGPFTLDPWQDTLVRRPL